MDRGAWRATVQGSTKSWTQLSDQAYSTQFLPVCQESVCFGECDTDTRHDTRVVNMYDPLRGFLVSRGNHT